MGEAKKFIDLSQVNVVTIDGTEQKVDVSKDLSSSIYNRAQSLEEHTACIDLYKTGKCEYSQVVEQAIVNFMEDVRIPWYMKQGILAALEAAKK